MDLPVCPSICSLDITAPLESEKVARSHLGKLFLTMVNPVILKNYLPFTLSQGEYLRVVVMTVVQQIAQIK